MPASHARYRNVSLARELVSPLQCPVFASSGEISLGLAETGFFVSRVGSWVVSTFPFAPGV